MVKKRCPGPFAILYFSDHGEDPTGKIQRSTSRQALKPEIFKIPFTVFLSDKYIKTYPEKTDALKNAFSQQSHDRLTELHK